MSAYIFFDDIHEGWEPLSDNPIELEQDALEQSLSTSEPIPSPNLEGVVYIGGRKYQEAAVRAYWNETNYAAYALN